MIYITLKNKTFNLTWLDLVYNILAIKSKENSVCK